MTTMQKAAIGTVLAAALGIGIYETRQASRLRIQVETLQQKQALWAQQIQQLGQAVSEATNQVATLREENQRLNRDTAELPKLRGEVGRLRREAEEPGALQARLADDRTATVMDRWLQNVSRLKRRLQETPGANIPELESLSEEDWLGAAKDELGSEADFRKALSNLRRAGEMKYAHIIGAAVKDFEKANNGQWPTDLSQLKPFFKTPVSDAILERYKITAADSLPTLTVAGVGGWVITQKVAVDLEYDTRVAVGPNITGGGSFEQSEIISQLTPAIQAYYLANDQRMPSEPTQLGPYATSPEVQAALEKATKQFEGMSPEERAESLKLLQRLRPK